MARSGLAAYSGKLIVHRGRRGAQLLTWRAPPLRGERAASQPADARVRGQDGAQHLNQRFTVLNRTHFGASAQPLTRRFATLPRRARAAPQNLCSGVAAQLVEYSAAEVSRRVGDPSAPGSGTAANSDLPAWRAAALGNINAGAARLSDPRPAQRADDALLEAFPLARRAPYSVRKGSPSSASLGAYWPHRKTARQAREAA